MRVSLYMGLAKTGGRYILFLGHERGSHRADLVSWFT